MKHRYVQYQFVYEDEPYFLHFYKRFFFSRWKMEKVGNDPVLYKIKDNEIIRIS